MTPADDKREYLDSLLTDLLEGGLDTDDLGDLQGLLAGDSEARGSYVDLLFVHAMLKWECALPESPPTINHSHTDVNLQTPPQNAPPQSPLLGFLGNLGAFLQRGITLLLVVSALTFVAWHLIVGRAKPSLPASNSVASHDRSDANSANGQMVAKVVSAAKCEGRERGRDVPQEGDLISVGQSIDLAAGAMEIYFQQGVRVVLQAPLRLVVKSSSELNLAAGKLTAEIVTPHAVGFKVKTPDAVYVDLGTEFGVEVTPVGSSRIHVFRGEVEVSLASHGADIPPRTLHESDGAVLGGKKIAMTFIKDTGESFLRSMDDVDRDKHVIAYWRFEDHPAGELIPDAQWGTANRRATVDSSFNGNDLYTFSMHTRPQFSENVPEGMVAQSSSPNKSCLDNTELPQEGAPTRDVYTHSPFSHAAPIDIQEITPKEWTVEASIRPAELGRVQTFVGRDGGETHINTPARLAFQLTPEGHPSIRYKDIKERFHTTTASDITLEVGKWAHLAAVSDGKKLRLYFNGIDGHGYRECAQVDLPQDSLTALSNVDPDAIWSVGRGKSANGWPGEWFRGWIDEVRISDIARAPEELLFSPRRNDLR